MTKPILLVFFFAFLALQQTILLSSNPSNTFITLGANTRATQSFDSTDLLNLGNGAQWLWQGINDKKPVTFQTKFYSSCDGPTTLIISARNNFTAILNGGANK